MSKQRANWSNKSWDSQPRVPAGTYRCYLYSVQEESRDKGDRWKLVWKVTEGEYQHREIWDWLRFEWDNDSSMRRTKAILCRLLGEQLDGEREINSEDLRGIFATVTTEEKASPEGDKIYVNPIFMAYEDVDRSKAGVGIEISDPPELPF